MSRHYSCTTIYFFCNYVFGDVKKQHENHCASKLTPTQQKIGELTPKQPTNHELLKFFIRVEFLYHSRIKLREKGYITTTMTVRPIHEHHS